MTVNALFYKHVTFSLLFVAVQQQQSEDYEWKQRSVKDLCSSVAPPQDVCLGGNGCTTYRAPK